MKSLIICATQRCGSTMLCEDLTAAGIGRPNEWFHDWSSGQKNWEEEFALVQKKGTGNGIFSAKVMANQVGAVDVRLSSFMQVEGSGKYRYFFNAFKDSFWIWNRRRDVLDQAISHVIAKQRGIYHSIRNAEGFVPGAAAIATKKLPDVVFDFDEIDRECKKIEAENAEWGRYFASHALEPLVVWYEDSIDGSATNKLCEIFGREKSFNGKRNLVKMPSETNKRLRDQYVLEREKRQ